MEPKPISNNKTKRQDKTIQHKNWEAELWAVQNENQEI